MNFDDLVDALLARGFDSVRVGVSRTPELGPEMHSYTVDSYDARSRKISSLRVVFLPEGRLDAWTRLYNQALRDLFPPSGAGRRGVG